MKSLIVAVVLFVACPYFVFRYIILNEEVQTMETLRGVSMYRVIQHMDFNPPSVSEVILDGQVYLLKSLNRLPKNAPKWIFNNDGVTM